MKRPWPLCRCDLSFSFSMRHDVIQVGRCTCKLCSAAGRPFDCTRADAHAAWPQEEQRLLGDGGGADGDRPLTELASAALTAPQLRKRLEDAELEERVELCAPTLSILYLIFFLCPVAHACALDHAAAAGKTKRRAALQGALAAARGGGGAGGAGSGGGGGGGGSARARGG